MFFGVGNSLARVCAAFLILGHARCAECGADIHIS
jgi:hypothetical protein